MKSWPTKNLGDVCNVVGGGTPSKSRQDFYSGSIPWATVRDMKFELIISTEHSITSIAVKNSSTNVIPEGNVVIATRVGLGKICMIGQDTAINQDLRGVIPKNIKTLEVGFLYWWFKSIAPSIVAEGTGATVQGVKLPFVKSLQIPLPPLPEQKRIVAILDEAFAGIDAAVANTENNLANARELFESYLNGVFTQKGDGWVEKTLGNCFRLKSGDGLTSKAMIAGDYSVFGGNGVAGTHNDYNLSGENVIIGRVGALCGNARHLREKIWLTDNAFKVVDQKYSFDSVFLTYLLNFKNLRSFARQAAQPVISNSSLKDIDLSFPESTIEQRQIVERLDALRGETENLEKTYSQKIAALTELKQTILQKAFAGELTQGVPHV